MPTGQAARGRVVLGTLVLAVGPALAAEQGPAIGHAPVGCVVAGKFPRFEARFDPAATVARVAPMGRYDEVFRRSLTDPAGFWAEAAAGLRWRRLACPAASATGFPAAATA